MRTRNLKGGVLWQRWKFIPDYEGYYRCSSLGRVRSVSRVIMRSNGASQIIHARILSGWVSTGYPMVTLCIGGTHKAMHIHQLVSITFLGHKQCKFDFVVDHKDGNKKKNYLSNLQIVTSRENTSVCFISGRENYTSQFVGVTWDKSRDKWMAHIRIGKSRKTIGRFLTEIEASNAYQNELLKIK